MIHKNTLVRQKEIVSAARKLIIRYGSEHVTVRRIAKEIGISEGALYRHFKSKKDVLSFLVDDIETTLVGDIEKNSSPESDVLESLQRVLRSHLSAIEQRKGVSFQVIAEIVSLGDRKLNSKISNVIGRYTSRIKDILADGIKSGVVREDIDLDGAAILFFGMIEGLVDIWALSHYSLKLEERYLPLWKLYRKAVARH